MSSTLLTRSGGSRHGRRTRLGGRPVGSRAATVGALLATALATAPIRAGAQDPRDLGEISRSFEDLSARVSPAVVQIFASGLSIRRAEAGSGEDIVGRQNASGSGVIVDPTGYIVTNAHVVSGATHVLVSLPEPPASAPRQSILQARGAMLEARIVGTDAESDLAVLKIERDSLPYVPFGDSDDLSQGELVFAFGSPLGLDNSVSMGVVSSVARQLQPEGPMIYVQTDAAVNPGNSGGPLVDTGGRLVGVNTLIFSHSGGSDGLSFAAPSNIVRNQCPYCRSSHPVIERFLEQHPNVQVVYRHLPLVSLHPLADDAARASICAEEQSRFEPMHSLLMGSNTWMDGRSIQSLVELVGIPDSAGFATCLYSSRTTDRLADDRSLASALGINGTPAFVSQQRTHHGEISSVEELETLLDADRP